MNEQRGGHYPIGHRTGEINRLEVQATAMAPDTEVLLELSASGRVGVAPILAAVRAASPAS